MRRRKTGKLRTLLFALFLTVVMTGAKERKQKAAPSLAILAGTVFRDTGFALRDAEVIVTPEPVEKKKTEWRAISDARGEFFLRLPPGPASYNVVVRARGFKEMRKTVTYAADERLDFTFPLDPNGGKK